MASLQVVGCAKTDRQSETAPNNSIKPGHLPRPTTAVVLAGCGGTITATRPSDVSVPTTETTRGSVTHGTAATSSPAATSVAGGGEAASTSVAGGGEAVSTPDAPAGEEQEAGGPAGNGPVVVSPLKVSAYIESYGQLWSNHKPYLDKGIADYCGQAGLPANCVGIDVDTSADPSPLGPCAIHGYKYHEPVYPGDRITVMLESPCSDDGLTAGDGRGGDGSTDSTDITDGTDSTEITDDTGGTQVTEDTAGADGAGGDTTPSQ